MANRSVTVAAVDVEALEREAQGAIAAASTRAALDDARVQYLGRKSELKSGAARRARPRDWHDAERRARAPRGGIRGTRGGAGARRTRPARTRRSTSRCPAHRYGADTCIR